MVSDRRVSRRYMERVAVLRDPAEKVARSA
jgi:hypothetical protein